MIKVKIKKEAYLGECTNTRRTEGKIKYFESYRDFFDDLMGFMYSDYYTPTIGEYTGDTLDMFYIDDGGDGEWWNANISIEKEDS